MELLKKKFFLVKVLAVVLGIEVVLVLTIPPILKMVKQNNVKDWNKLLYQFEEVIKTNTSTIDPLSNVYKIKLSNICTNYVNDSIKDYMDVEDVTISCYSPNADEGRYTFTFTGQNQHKWRSAVVKCDGQGICEITSNRSEVD